MGVVSVNDKSNIDWYDRFEFVSMEHLIKRVEKYYNRELTYLKECNGNYIIIIDRRS